MVPSHEQAKCGKNLAFCIPGGLAYKQRVPDAFVEPINASTRFCAVLGHPVRHSASPAMQNAALAALGLDWRYLAFEVLHRDLRAAIAGARAMRFIGPQPDRSPQDFRPGNGGCRSMKMPGCSMLSTRLFLKRPAPKGDWIPLGRAADGMITEIRSHGHNTDAAGLARSLKEDFQWPDLRGASGAAFSLGAGGAARGRRPATGGGRRCQPVPGQSNRGQGRRTGGAVAARFPAVNIIQSLPRDPVDLVINATSLGLKADDPPPLDEGWLKSQPPDTRV